MGIAKKYVIWSAGEPQEKHSDEGKIHERDDRTLVTGTPIRRGRKTHNSSFNIL